MPDCKFLGYQDLSNSLYSSMKTSLGETLFLRVHFYMEKPYKNFGKGNFQTAVKIVWQVVLTQILHLGINFDAESEFGIHFVSGSAVTTCLVLMSRTDFENR